MVGASAGVYVPRALVIATACVIIFVGFLIAAVCHVYGMLADC